LKVRVDVLDARLVEVCVCFAEFKGVGWEEGLVWFANREGEGRREGRDWAVDFGERFWGGGGRFRGA